MATAAVTAFVVADAALDFLVLVLNLYSAAGGMVGPPFSLMHFDTHVEAAAAFSLDHGGMMEGECCQY